MDTILHEQLRRTQDARALADVFTYIAQSFSEHSSEQISRRWSVRNALRENIELVLEQDIAAPHDEEKEDFLRRQTDDPCEQALGIFLERYKLADKYSELPETINGTIISLHKKRIVEQYFGAANTLIASLSSTEHNPLAHVEPERAQETYNTLLDALHHAQREQVIDEQNINIASWRVKTLGERLAGHKICDHEGIHIVAYNNNTSIQLLGESVEELEERVMRVAHEHFDFSLNDSRTKKTHFFKLSTDPELRAQGVSDIYSITVNIPHTQPVNQQVVVAHVQEHVAQGTPLEKYARRKEVQEKLYDLLSAQQ